MTTPNKIKYIRSLLSCEEHIDVYGDEAIDIYKTIPKTDPEYSTAISNMIAIYTYTNDMNRLQKAYDLISEYPGYPDDITRGIRESLDTISQTLL